MMYQDPFVTLHCGDSRDVLTGMPAESVDMVMTSPPYYGLRSYKADSAVWDSVNGCLHEWGSEMIRRDRGVSAGVSAQTGNQKKAISGVETKQGNFCHLCGAWRGQLGAEPDPDLFIKHLCDIFDLVKRVLKKTGSIYVNLDDSHAGSNNGSNDYRQIQGLNPKRNGNIVYDGQRPGRLHGVPAKSLIGIPERFMLEMIRRGWICRNVLIWHKRSVMPESVRDRYTIDFERIFFFTKSPKYFFERQFEPSVDAESYSGRRKRNVGSIESDQAQNYGFHGSIQDDGTLKYGQTYPNRNKRAVWTVNPQGFAGPHYATYPEELCRVPIESSCPEFICTRCGKPKVKVYETGALLGRSEKDGDGYLLSKSTVAGMEKINSAYAHANDSFLPNHRYDTKLIGLSDCKCGVPFEPGVCLDPFSGVGTTCVMAKKLGRRSIGIEISEKYHQLVIKRIQSVVARMM